MGILKIDLLGTSFAIQAKESDEYLQNLLSYYKQILKQVESGSQLRDNLKTSVLAGIMLCDELYKEKLKNQNRTPTLSSSLDTIELSEVEKLTLKMIDDIDKVLS